MNEKLDKLYNSLAAITVIVHVIAIFAEVLYLTCVL